MTTKVMKKKDLKRYRDLLNEERGRLLEQLNFDREQIEDLERKDIGDLIDRAFNMYEKGRTIEMSEKEKRHLVAIDEAFARMEKNIYGVCVICGSQIDKQRLEAIPWAATCVNTIECQARRKSQTRNKTS